MASLVKAATSQGRHVISVSFITPLAEQANDQSGTSGNDQERDKQQHKPIWGHEHKTKRHGAQSWR